MYLELPYYQLAVQTNTKATNTIESFSEAHLTLFNIRGITYEKLWDISFIGWRFDFFFLEETGICRIIWIGSKSTFSAKKQPKAKQ